MPKRVAVLALVRGYPLLIGPRQRRLHVPDRHNAGITRQSAPRLIRVRRHAPATPSAPRSPPDFNTQTSFAAEIPPGRYASVA